MKQSSAWGRADAPYLFVMVSEPSENMEAWFWRQAHKAGILKTECRVVFMIDGAPAGKSNKPLVAQVRSARERFDQEVRRSSPTVVVPMDTKPFYALTGINESVLDARGYLIRKRLFHPVPTEVWKQVGTYKNASRATGAKKGDPKMKFVTEAGDPLLGLGFEGVVIPAFSLDYIRTSQFAVAPAFQEDLKRAKRAHHGELVEVGKKFKYVSDVAKLPEPEKFGLLLAVDIETHGVDNEVIDLVSFSDGKTTAAVDWTESARLYVERLFALPGRLYAIHNSPFDLPRLVANGVAIEERVIDEQVVDTMYGAVQVQPDLHKGLGRVASVYNDLEPWKTASWNKNSHWRALVAADPHAYSAKDAFNTYWTAVQLIAVMRDLGIWKYFMGRDGHPGPGVMATIPELTGMSRIGVRTDRDFARSWCGRLERRLLRYMKLWSRMFPSVSPASNPQVTKLLYKEWGLPVQRTADGVTADELALVRLKAYMEEAREDDMVPGAWQTDPRAIPRTLDLLLRIRDTSKLIKTYVQPVLLSAETWVHPSYLPASKDDERGGKKMDNKGTTSTGRLATFKPNLANQPKKTRWLYVPDSDDMCFVQADFKNAELYALAGASGDQRLLADLVKDMHQLNADRLGISRKVAKNVTYASQYLAGPGKQSDMILEQEHLYVSPSDCLTISEEIWGYYTDATAYKRYLVELCETKRFITNAFGRTRFFHGGRAPAAVDFIPQSTVADILWCVLRDVARFLRTLGGRIVTTVYDSILGCVPADRVAEAAAGMKRIMERRFDCVRKDFYIPVEIEVGAPGASWGELKKYESAA